MWVQEGKEAAGQSARDPGMGQEVRSQTAVQAETQV